MLLITAMYAPTSVAPTVANITEARYSAAPTLLASNSVVVLSAKANVPAMRPSIIERVNAMAPERLGCSFRQGISSRMKNDMNVVDTIKTKTEKRETTRSSVGFIFNSPAAFM